MSVSDLIRAATHSLERGVGTIWVEGEIASLSRPSSGHIYFALGDGRAQVRAVMWRSDAGRLKFRVENGQKLRCRGRLGIYERDGKFQLYVGYAEPAGLGADALALEQLKRKLAAEGLFETARKRPLPPLPRRIGVVTSKTGAAVRDIIRAVHRRFPVPILVADTVVQGPSAPKRIAAAVRAISRTDVDVVIVGRGGGSATDLSAFNDEAVVRAMAQCPVPTISAVGHEIDITLTDMVADWRAATPTMAGERAVPVLADLARLLHKEQRRLDRELEMRFRSARQELDQLSGRADSSVSHYIARRRALLAKGMTRLEACHPRAQLATRRGELDKLEARLSAAARARVDSGRRRFADLASRLGAMSPLRVLERGYAIASSDERVLVDGREVDAGDKVSVRLSRGVLDCTVDAVRADDHQEDD